MIFANLGGKFKVDLKIYDPEMLKLFVSYCNIIEQLVVGRKGKTTAGCGVR